MARRLFAWLSAVGVCALASAGCRDAERVRLEARLPMAALPEPSWDDELLACQKRLAVLATEPSLPGAPDFDARRAEILGRARGEAVLWVAAPAPTPEASMPEEAREALRAAPRGPAPGTTTPEGETGAWRQRIEGLLRRLRGKREALRAVFLRQGYVYSENSVEAFELVRALRLTTLFDEPRIWLERGSRRAELERVEGREPSYRYVRGELAGQPAEILHGDRVGESEADFATPLQRDVPSLAHEVGFDRLKVELITPTAIVAQLRFGDQAVRTVLDSDGAALALRCIDAPREQRRAVDAFRSADAPRLRALAQLRHAVGSIVAEGLPFDRPRGAKDHLEDGSLRPRWEWAYSHGDIGFMYDGEGYAVFDASGRPNPPEVCVAFVIDSFERASGTWYRSQGEARERFVGALDFGTFGIANRSGVLSFADFAESKPESFQVIRFAPRERIEFRERSRYFANLVARADDIRAGDVVAIQGVKRDGNIHQHAILVEDTDPVTGFPHGLADQMKRPRRRTWEGIMAEAPKRALLYRIRLLPGVLLELDRGGEPSEM